MTTRQKYYINIFILGAIAVLVCSYVLVGNGAAALPLNNSLKLQDLAQTFAALIAWLFVVALFVERAVEVIVMVFRDQQADLLDEAEAHTAATAAALAVSTTATPADKDKAAKDAATAREQKVIYRGDTKQLAMSISFILGILVSLAGVHALNGILAKDTVSGPLFKILDVFITGGMIAGGSEGIHRMANAFTSTMDSLSTRADQAAQKKKPEPMITN